MPQPATFAAQMKTFFGFRPGDKVPDFMRELRELDDEDRAEYTRMLNEAGYPVHPPNTPPVPLSAQSATSAT